MDNSVRILYLEDDPADAELVQATLDAAGMACQVTRVETCEEFRRALAEGGYDIVLADYTLPAYDGMSALQRARELSPVVPFIFVSGTMGENAAIEALTGGATDYVLKHRLSRLAPAVKRALREAENSRERQRAEQALRESEKRFRLLYENAPLAYQSLDADGRFLEVNAAWLRLLGYLREEVIGRSVLECLTPPCQELFRERFPRFKAAGEMHDVEFDMVRKDGTVVIVSVDGLIAYDETREFRETHCILHDVTRRKQMEESLREHEREYQTVLQSAMDGFAVADARGRLLDVNEAYCRMIGYSRNELLQMSIPDLQAVDAQADAARYVEEVCRQGFARFESRFRRKDGRLIDVEVSASLVPHVAERCYAFVRDVTERKRSEEQLQRLRSELTHVSRLSTAGEMVAGIAHEVNKPLYSIANYAKACCNVLALDEPDLEDLREWTREIAAAAARAGEITRRLLDFVRRAEPQRISARIGEVIEEAISLLAAETRGLPVVVRRQFADAETVVNVDRIQIQQVLVNLLRNACEALEAKDAAAKEVTIRTAVGGDSVEVSVADNGPGLPDPGASRLFEPFFTTKPEGLGMGLAISKTIVEAHGGRIWATARPGGGATFHFTLPKA